MPAQPKHAEQTARDRGGLRNDRAIYLDIIDFVLKIDAIGLATGECQSQLERWLVESGPGWQGES